MLFGKQAHCCFSSLEFGSPLWKLSAISAYTCLPWNPQTPPSPSQNETLWFYTSLCLHQVADCVSSPAMSDSPLCSMYLHLTKTVHTKACWMATTKGCFLNADKDSVIVVCLCVYVLYWQRTWLNFDSSCLGARHTGAAIHDDRIHQAPPWHFTGQSGCIERAKQFKVRMWIWQTSSTFFVFKLTLI